MTEAKKREEALQQQVTEARHLAELADRRAEENSAYMRRNNLRIFGLAECSAESPQQCEDKVLALFRNQLKVNVSRDDIEAVHRVGQRRPEPSSSSSGSSDFKPRGIIVRFISRRVRDNVLYSRKKLKGSRLVLVEDLSPRMYSLMSTVRSDTEVCVQAWSRNGQVMMKTHSGEKVHVQSVAHLRQPDQRAKWAKR